MAIRLPPQFLGSFKTEAKAKVEPPKPATPHPDTYSLRTVLLRAGYALAKGQRGSTTIRKQDHT